VFNSTNVMMRRNAKKDGNWQPSWILAAILKFFI